MQEAEQPEQEDNRDRDPEEPEKNTAHFALRVLLTTTGRINARWMGWLPPRHGPPGEPPSSGAPAKRRRRETPCQRLKTPAQLADPPDILEPPVEKGEGRR